MGHHPRPDPRASDRTGHHRDGGQLRPWHPVALSVSLAVRNPAAEAGDKTTSNVYGIIQGALWCKGYSTGSSITTHFYAGTGNAIRGLKADMGIGGDSTVTVDIMRALLSMDQFVLLARYGGIPSIRSTQQKLNREYRAYVGIIPTDGLYGREMNTALIKTLQAVEGYSPDKATGNFGLGTRSKLVEIDAANAPTYPKWVWLASVLLVCNGYPVRITQEWHGATDAGLDQFQKDYALPRNGKIDPTTWMSLMTSKGDPDRPCDACDTRF